MMAGFIGVFITITLDYNSSHIELLLDNEFLTVVWILNWSLAFAICIPESRT
jgi:hypothetical protein